MLDLRFAYMTKFKKAAVGGTFDHFHLGHEQLLKTAFETAQRVVIGISSSRLAEKKPLAGLIEPLSRRSQSVKRFLKKQRWLGRASIVVLEHPAGPVLDDVSIEAVVVSPQTKNKARFLQDKRPELKIVVCKTVYSDDQKYLSATRIRLGEIDRQGLVFLPLTKKTIWSKLSVRLPAGLRSQLKKPLGKLWKRSDGLVKSLKKQPPTVLIAVGDVVGQLIAGIGILPQLLIVDGLVGRRSGGQVQYGPAAEMTVVKNPAGLVSKELVEAVKKMVGELTEGGEKKLWLRINGEEDLAVIPAVLAAPLGSVVLYGQPKKGVVEVKVSEKSKARFFRLWQRFSHN